MYFYHVYIIIMPAVLDGHTIKPNKRLVPPP